MSAVEVKKKYEPLLLKTPGVVGVYASRGKIVVLVVSVDVCIRIPKSLEGVPVECRVVGRIVAGSS